MSLYKVLVLESIYKLLKEGIEEVKPYYPNIPDDKFNDIVKLDPTYQGGNQLGNYGKWLLARYNRLYKQGFNPNIDTNIKSALTLYNNFKKNINRPIDSIKTFDELIDITNEYQNQTPELSNRQKKQQIRNDAELFYEDDTWKVIIPKTEEASCLYGANTKWCTTGRENNLFNVHNKFGPLYIFINKKDNEKYQLHFETDQLMDELNQRVDKEEFFNRLPKELIQKFQSRFIDNISNDSLWFKYIINLNEEMKMKFIKKNGFVIKYINNPSEEMQLEAVKQKGRAIEYIKNPSEMVQLEAVKQNDSAIKYIKNPTEKVQIEVVKQNGNAIEYIKNPSEMVQLEAVKENGRSIEYIENPSEKVQIEAVKQNGLAIQYIKNPSEEVQLESVKKYRWLIIYIKNPTEKVKEYIENHKKNK